MSESNNSQTTSISKATTIEEIADFWDSHSLDDYWDQTREVEFEVRAIRRHHVALEPDLYTRLAEQARVRGVALETLINLWLVEKLDQTSNRVAA